MGRFTTSLGLWATFAADPAFCGPARRMEHCMSTLMRFWREEDAATAIEYALIAGGISIVIISAVTSVGTSLKNTFTNVSTQLGSQ
jgi:pilus assembly protein Flp/PilA